jgi:hypothetical protein
MFKELCNRIGTNAAFTSVYHHQTNGAVEIANALIFEANKKIVEGKKKGKLGEVMTNVIWSHNT